MSETNVSEAEFSVSLLETEKKEVNDMFFEQNKLRVAHSEAVMAQKQLATQVERLESAIVQAGAKLSERLEGMAKSHGVKLDEFGLNVSTMTFQKLAAKQ